MHYESRLHFFGLPLIHIACGPRLGGLGSRGVARGWIAIGDIAIGVIAIGGVATGAISIGGLGAGVLSIGGLALGVACVGGVAVGLLAVGGMAVGWWAAVGGLGIARDVAMGGAAVARHANDATATAYVDSHLFFRVASWLMNHSITLVFLPMMVVLLLVIARLRRGSSPGDMT